MIISETLMICPKCNGTGVCKESYEDEGSHGRMSTYYHNVECYQCNGTGRVIQTITIEPFVQSIINK